MKTCQWGGCGYQARMRCVGCGLALCGRHFPNFRDDCIDMHALKSYAPEALHDDELRIASIGTGSAGWHEGYLLKEIVRTWGSSGPGTPECWECVFKRTGELRAALDKRIADAEEAAEAKRVANAERRVRGKQIAKSTPEAVRIKVRKGPTLWAVRDGQKIEHGVTGYAETPWTAVHQIFLAQDGRRYLGSAGLFGSVRLYED